jgi:drug/metabolite transporter (DMT)-like permease
MRPPSTKDWIVLLLLGTVWGCSFIMIKKAVHVFNPLQMTSWRMVLAWAVYLPVALAYWSKIDWTKWKYLAGVAFFGSAIPNFMFAVAQQHVNSGLAGVLNSLTPFFTLLLGVSFFGMTFTRNKAIGVLLGLTGAVILVWFNSGGTVSGNFYFAALCVLATICYAINANLVNTHLREEHPAAIASAAFMVTGIVFLGMLWWSGGIEAARTNPKGLEGLGYVFYLAAIGTVVGSIVYFWLLQRTSAIFATSVTYLLPVVALLIGLLDGETLSVFDGIGTGVILAGVYLARK